MAGNARPGSGGADVGCEVDESEDLSSSSYDVPGVSSAIEGLNLQDETESTEPEDELSLFRQQWQRELEGTPAPKEEAPKPGPEVEEPLNDEEKAKQLFLSGVELERSGKLYEAIRQYKRAMQIVPDVEARLYEADLRPETPQEEEPSEEVVRETEANESEDEDAVEGEDLLARLQRIVARRGFLCEPEIPTKSAHISWLPYELVLLVLRWAVSAELDARALERAGAACRGLHVAARDPDLWRAMCLRTWGIECGGLRGSGFGSWRQMFIERPRLRLHGCYISKTTYLRHGENSFQDQFYRPWHLIDYYRYLRFFPEGHVLMLTTADEPAACVSLLRTRAPRPGLGIVAGHYRLIGDKVVIVIKKTTDKKITQPSSTRFRARRKETPETHEQIFHMEFQLRSVRSRLGWQLSWRRYAVCARAQWTQFELAPGKFPPLAFSPVRAYTAQTHAPLV